jgi:propionyl-CoA carboxylase alpha chain
LPSIGPLLNYKEPMQVANEADIGTVRIDTGVFEGGTVSMYYDAMISKLCTHAPTRYGWFAVRLQRFHRLQLVF